MFIATSGQSYPIPGDSAYRIYLKKNLDYPASARQHGIEGDVTVGFTVKPDSTLSNFKIIDGIGSGCDEEAIRLLKQGPGWVPRISNGKPVSSEVIYKVPFRLNP
jgi:protein TonB